MPSATRQCERCQRNRAVRFFSGPRGRVCSDCLTAARRRSSKDRRLRQTYGITLDDFERLLEAQRGPTGEILCAACAETRQGNYRWSVDHDHRIEQAKLEAGWPPDAAARASVRGLVCRRCNGVMRDVRDSWLVLSNLAHYALWGHDRTQRVLNEN